MLFLCWWGGCKESEIKFSHARHINRGLKDCDFCPPYKEDLEPDRPKIAKCLTCHMKNFDPGKPESCFLCHTKPGPKIKVKHDIPKKYKDLKFTHKVHLENNVACEQCHAKIATSDEITPDLIHDMFDTCIPCHKERGKRKVLHVMCATNILRRIACLFIMKTDGLIMMTRVGFINTETNSITIRITASIVMTTRTGVLIVIRIKSPETTIMPGAEKLMGLPLRGNEKKCSVCHQEDFCVRCHENTTPVSHTASWGGVNTRNRHCRACHFPISMLNCTVCHTSPAHPTAIESPHPPFAGDCFQPGCHQLGRVGEATHPSPIGIACTVCHKR